MLQTTLDEAVNNEAYEDAARLRDQIKAIRKKMAE
jgi:protein-arginine kinase activator protein McsA